MRFAMLCAAAMLTSVAPCRAVGPASPTPQSLLQAEDALFDADVHHDVATIDRGFADEAMFVHANGMVQTKADYLKAAAGHRFEITQITTEQRSARVFADVGIVRGIKRLVVGDGMHLGGSYLTIYVFRDGRWQMLDEQSSPLPPSDKP